MRVVIEQRDFGRWYDFFLIEEPVFGGSIRVLRFDGWDEESGAHMVTAVEVPEGERSPVPSFSLDVHAYNALRQAFGATPETTAIGMLTDTLGREQRRVDKLIDAVLAPPITLNRVIEPR